MLTVRLPQALEDRLKQTAAAEKRTKTQVIRALRWKPISRRNAARAAPSTWGPTSSGARVLGRVTCPRPTSMSSGNVFVPNALVDAGPLIALFDKDDKHHSRARDVLARTKATLVTTWPVVTETWHMLDFSAEAQLGMLEWIYRGAARLHLQTEVDLERLIGLTKRYRDRPMDLADASLVLASEQLGLLEIISVDRDFDIYRSGGKKRFVNLFYEE